jgi:hypothetical protein
MKKIFLTITAIIILCNVSLGQTPLDRTKAEEVVKNYMTTKTKNYKPLEFGEFFSQYYSESLQKTAKTKEVIKYSIIHTYLIKNKKTVDTYFHLNEHYQVIGHNTMEEMTKLVSDDLKNNPKFDSILKSIELDIQK